MYPFRFPISPAGHSRSPGAIGMYRNAFSKKVHTMRPQKDRLPDPPATLFPGVPLFRRVTPRGAFWLLALFLLGGVIAGSCASVGLGLFQGFRGVPLLFSGIPAAEQGFFPLLYHVPAPRAPLSGPVVPAGPLRAGPLRGPSPPLFQRGGHGHRRLFLSGGGGPSGTLPFRVLLSAGCGRLLPAVPVLWRAGSGLFQQPGPGRLFRPGGIPRLFRLREGPPGCSQPGGGGLSGGRFGGSRFRGIFSSVSKVRVGKT